MEERSIWKIRIEFDQTKSEQKEYISIPIMVCIENFENHQMFSPSNFLDFQTHYLLLLFLLPIFDFNRLSYHNCVCMFVCLCISAQMHTWFLKKPKENLKSHKVGITGSHLLCYIGGRLSSVSCNARSTPSHWAISPSPTIIFVGRHCCSGSSPKKAHLS